MSKVSEIERKTQDRVVILLAITLNYNYLGNFQDKEDFSKQGL
jgi:hypothetical protein